MVEILIFGTFFLNSIRLIGLLLFIEIYNQKFQLKDKYSHDLGNIIQSILGANSLIMPYKINENELQNLTKLIDKKY